MQPNDEGASSRGWGAVEKDDREEGYQRGEEGGRHMATFPSREPDGVVGLAGRPAVCPVGERKSRSVGIHVFAPVHRWNKRQTFHQMLVSPLCAPDPVETSVSA